MFFILLLSKTGPFTEVSKMDSIYVSTLLNQEDNFDASETVVGNDSSLFIFLGFAFLQHDNW